MTTSSQDPTAGTATESFERALATLVIESFARGADVEGTWEITPGSNLVPNWRVVVEKTSAAELPTDGGVFVDE